MENKTQAAETNQLLEIVLIQLKVTNDKATNLKRAEEMIDSAVKLYSPKIVVLPEYFNTPASLKNLENFVEDGDNFESDSIKLLTSTAKKHSVYIVGGSMPVYFKSDKSKVYNTCYCVDKSGQIKTIFSKLHMFDIDIPGKISFKESKKITPGNTYGVFETEYGNIGVGICYDIRFPEYALTMKKEHNIKMLFYPAAFNSVTGPMHWDIYGKCRAVDNQVFLGLCSPSRNYENPEDYQAYGHSTVVDPFGQVVTTTGYEEDIVFAKLNLGLLEDIKAAIPVWSQRRWDLYGLNK